MNSLRFIRSATEPLSPDQHRHFTEAFGTKIMNSYGMTEAFGTCLTVPLHQEPVPSVALSPFGMEARICDGELQLRGATFFQPGWYATGDLASQDDQGRYLIQGRIKDLISINGAKIAPAVVERMLLERHPDIGEVVVFGKHSVHVLYDGDCNTNDLMTDIRSLCLGYRPALVQRVDSIPRADSGKVSRSMLVAQMCAD